MEDKNTWTEFEKSGKINDYLAYKGYQQTDNVQLSEALINNADKNPGDSVKTAEYR